MAPTFNRLTLSTETRLQGAIDAAPGLIGAVLSRPEIGDLWALTAAQVVFGAETVTATTDAGEELLIRAPRIDLTEEPVQRSEALIARLLLPHLIRFDPNPRLPQREREILPAYIVSRPWRALGRTVVVFGARGRTVARLVSVDARFSMPHPASKSRITFTAALELEGEDRFVAAGDAGALIATEDGGLLGIILAGMDRRAFGAALAPVAERYELEPLTDAAALAHNQSLQTQGHPEATDLRSRYRDRLRRIKAAGEIRQALVEPSDQEAFRDDALADSALGALET